MTESKLLAEFAASRSETAFEALLKLHLNLVFATAMRQLGDRGLAEEVTQNVFIALARKPPSLRWERTLAGWLYQTTVNQSRQRLRTELRRQHREQKAHDLSMITREGDSTWAALIPLLDEALLGLRDQDRLAVILHFMEGRSLREVGASLGVGEDAARKRINRVVQNLGSWFQRRGFTVPTGTIVSALSLEGMAAPAALLPSVLAASLSASGLAAASSLSSLAIFQLMTASQSKFIVAGILLALCVGTPFILRQLRSTNEDPTPSNGTAAIPKSSLSSSTAPPRFQVNAAQIEPGPTPQVSPLPREKSVFERINDGDESLSYLSREAAEAFLARNSTNAESLLTAFEVTNDISYLRKAATNFPSHPSVLLRVAAHDAFPENRRAWLEHFKTTDPGNALAYYLSAREHLQNNQLEAAFQDLTQAQNKPFQDYTTEHMIALEDIYLASGKSPGEAKMLGMAAVELPHLSRLVEMSEDMTALMEQYSRSGESASAESMARFGLGLAGHLNSVQEGGNLLGQMVSLRVERKFLDQLDPATTYPFLQEPISSRLEAISAREQSIRGDSQFFSRWISQTTEAEVIHYFDRLKFYGEAAALEWLRTRHPEL